MTRRRLGRLRIIGGRWRSRLVEFEAQPGLRPTPDRVRQTLFDWLAPRIEGASVLDLFAGSGALGLEALSRGAAQVTFVESGRAQAQAIRAALVRLGAGDEARVVADTAQAHLQSTASRYDVVLLDPPYDTPLLAEALALLPPHLEPDNRVYLEWRLQRRPPLGAGWRWLRDSKAGQVSYGLATYSAEGTSSDERQ